MAEKVKIQTRINSFEEVQKSLQTIEEKLNELSGAVNVESEGQATDKEGKSGDIRVTKNPDKSHKLEVKTEEGWKYGSLGEKPVKYIDKPAEFSKPTAIKSGNLPVPDYETEWLTIGEEVVTGSFGYFTGNHNLETIPSHFVYLFTPDSGVNVHFNIQQHKDHIYDSGLLTHHYSDYASYISFTTNTWEIARDKNGWGIYYNNGGLHNITSGALKLKVWK